VPTGTPVPFADAPAAFEYVLPPVIQHVTETSATIFFELPDAQTGMVVAHKHAAAPGNDLVIPFEDGSSRQQITLTQLEPGATYDVTIGVADDQGLYRQVMYARELWGPLRVRTLPKDRPVRIGVFGDSGFGSRVTYNLAERMAQEDLDFVIHTGDVVYNIEENTDPFEAFRLKWYLPLKPLLTQLPVYPVVGNHDVEQEAMWDGLPFYYRAFPPFADPDSDNEGLNQWYAFGVKDVQFLLLDSQTFFGEDGYGAQNEWLADRLADERFTDTVTVLHVAPYTSSNHRYDGQQIQFVWMPMFEESNVRLVLSGHSHNYERLTYNGITYIVSGGGSEVLYPLLTELPFSQAFAAQSHYVVLEIDSEQIHTRAENVDGEIIDEGTIPLE
jgi:predicted phosphodiesterase